MGDTYRAHFSYHRKPIYRINFQLVLNAAYSFPSRLKYWLVIKTKSDSISAPKNARQTDEYKHCTVHEYNHLTLHLWATGCTFLNGGHAALPLPLRTARLYCSGVVIVLPYTQWLCTVACRWLRIFNKIAVTSAMAEYIGLQKPLS